MPPLTYRPMTMDDYDAVLALWQRSPGVWVGQNDTPDATARFLQRNPGLSLVATDGPRLVGVILAGHDGRRGLLYHLAVEENDRRRGVGRTLVERCCALLYDEGIRRCYLWVLSDNEGALGFWKALGWKTPEHAVAMVRTLEAPGNGDTDKDAC